MYTPVSGPAVPVATKGRGAWPLAAICCLGLLGFLIVATIVLALIPVYLPSKSTTIANTTTDDYNFLVQYEATPTNATNPPAGTVTNPADIGTAAGVGNNGQFAEGAAQASQTTSTQRRRRGVFNRREKRAVKSDFLFICRPSFGTSCSSTTCRSAVVSQLKRTLENKNFSTDVKVRVNGTVTTYEKLTLRFIQFLSISEKPAWFTKPGSTTFNFTAKQTGDFTNPATWEDNIIPYGNASVIIPSGITVTIQGSTLDVPVRQFDISGTLAIGSGASSFKFSYPTSIIIHSGGTLQDLTTSKTLTLPPDSVINNIPGGTGADGSTVIIGSSSRKRAIGDRFVIRSVTITMVVIQVFFTFPRVTPYCRRSGPFSSPHSYHGGFFPHNRVCGSGCGLHIPSGVVLTTAELVGVMTIRIDVIGVAAGGVFQIGSPGVSGFRFSSAIQFNVFGTLGFVGSGGSIGAIGGCFLNLLGGAKFESAVSVSLVTFTATGAAIGAGFPLIPGVVGPVYVSVSVIGVVIQSPTPVGPIPTDGGGTGGVTAGPSAVTTTPFTG